MLPQAHTPWHLHAHTMPTLFSLISCSLFNTQQTPLHKQIYLAYSVLSRVCFVVDFFCKTYPCHALAALISSKALCSLLKTSLSQLGTLFACLFASFFKHQRTLFISNSKDVPWANSQHARSEFALSEFSAFLETFNDGRNGS